MSNVSSKPQSGLPGYCAATHRCNIALGLLVILEISLVLALFMSLSVNDITPRLLTTLALCTALILHVGLHVLRTLICIRLDLRDQAARIEAALREDRQK